MTRATALTFSLCVILVIGMLYHGSCIREGAGASSMTLFSGARGAITAG